MMMVVVVVMMMMIYTDIYCTSCADTRTPVETANMDQFYTSVAI